MPGRVQRFLGKRSGTDGLRGSCLHDLDGSFDKTISCLSRCRRHLAERQVIRHKVQVQALHGARSKIRIVGFLQRIDFKPLADNLASLTQAIGVTNHQRITDCACFRLR
jgi:hypothetical protein